MSYFCADCAAWHESTTDACQKYQRDVAFSKSNAPARSAFEAQTLEYLEQIRDSLLSIQGEIKIRS